ncbi:MAG TPA: NAD-dependent epimerase/dehydratase family protein [Polyangiaceae bacterium]|nr:NAD-dependent epimerase/dehydratase family protein [Polyangiaceae bacterium]
MVAVSGGAGFIGSHLVRSLVAEGARKVIILDSLRYGDPSNLAGLGAKVELVPFTLGTDDPGRLPDLLAGVSGLFHLVAEKHNQSKDEPSRVLRANVEGTQQLFEAAARVGVSRIVFASSLYAYGRMSGPPFQENELPAPCTVYGVTKLAGEHLLRTAAQQHGFHWNVVRYMFVYGPRQFAGMGYKSVIVRNFERMLRGEPVVVYGDGNQTLDYVFVDDAVAATLDMFWSETSGEVFNIGSGQGITVSRLLQTMQDVGGDRRPMKQGPADWTAGSCRVADISKAREQLGWRPTTGLREGLERTFQFLRDEQPG